MKDFPQVQIESREEWRSWLDANHESAESIWLVTFKKASGKPYVAYDAVVEEAICFGWIDSLRRKLDDERSMLLLSPRKPGSAWSKVNKERVERMNAAEKMHPAGLRKIEQSKADGSWTFLDDVEALIVPDDLAAALAEYEHAEENFSDFPRSVKRGILEWIKQAKRAETRSKRVRETAELASKNVRAVIKTTVPVAGIRSRSRSLECLLG
ncbi:YdeI/OmpD-associated family protein [soil metagenome]